MQALHCGSGDGRFCCPCSARVDLRCALRDVLDAHNTPVRRSFFSFYLSPSEVRIALLTDLPCPSQSRRRHMLDHDSRQHRPRLVTARASPTGLICTRYLRTCGQCKVTAIQTTRESMGSQEPTTHPTPVAARVEQNLSPRLVYPTYWFVRPELFSRGQGQPWWDV